MCKKCFFVAEPEIPHGYYPTWYEWRGRRRMKVELWASGKIKYWHYRIAVAYPYPDTKDFSINWRKI